MSDAPRPARDGETLSAGEYVVVACHDCGLAYGSDGWIECIVPPDTWRRISPSRDDGGILCITCIARRLKRLGMDKVPVMLCGTEAIRVAGQEEAFDRGWNAAEKARAELESAVAALRAELAKLRAERDSWQTFTMVPYPAISMLGGCDCWNKAPSVPTCRDSMQHLEDCPARGSGYPVGTYIAGRARSEESDRND